MPGTRCIHWRGYVNVGGRRASTSSTRPATSTTTRAGRRTRAWPPRSTPPGRPSRRRAAGSSRPITTPASRGEACGANANGWQLFQWGTQACGLAGKTAAQILGDLLRRRRVSSAPPPRPATRRPRADRPRRRRRLAPSPTPTPVTPLGAAPGATPAPSHAGTHARPDGRPPDPPTAAAAVMPGGGQVGPRPRRHRHRPPILSRSSSPPAPGYRRESLPPSPPAGAAIVDIARCVHARRLSFERTWTLSPSTLSRSARAMVPVARGGSSSMRYLVEPTLAILPTHRPRELALRRRPRSRVGDQLGRGDVLDGQTRPT